ncbi:MAG TPA: hypothetical protein VGT05_02715 [Patescibacteria group bacterium]|nr:hypothetical protein [Patescibacteria group bacterium]
MILTRELETISFILIASIICLFVVFYLRQPKQFQYKQVITPLPHFISDRSPTLIPTTVPVASRSVVTSWISSDGAEKLTMKTTQNLKSTTYVFMLTNISTNTEKTLFTQILHGESTMSIPFNAFSSDDSYIFLKETLNDGNHYLVFKTSGEPFANGENDLDVTPLFIAYTSSYTINDVTGWASPTLLVVNTKNQNGSTGSSFWFDTTSQRFIQLATLFE